jgi:AraC-like DNA-binding protein
MLTSAYPAAAIQAYSDRVSETFFPLDFTFPKERARLLVSEFITREIGPLKATHASAQCSCPFVGTRSRSDISPRSPDQFILLIARSGLVRHTQFGRAVEIPAGHMVLIDSRSPYRSLQMTSSASALYVSIPGAPLRSAIRVPEDYCAIGIDAQTGLSAVVSDFLDSIWREFSAIDEAQKEVLSRKCIDLLATTIESSVGSRAPRAARIDEQHFAKAMNYIAVNLGDPDLSVGRVAKALRLSTGHVHAVARVNGVSICEMILSMRLERCREALADPRADHRSISDIAFTFGFNNAAHFSRTFKAKFGVSAREFRKQRRNQAAPRLDADTKH